MAFFDYEDVARQLKEKYTLKKEAAPVGSSRLADLLSDPKSFLPLIGMGMGAKSVYDLAQNKINNFSEDRTKRKSRETFFKLHPDLEKDPEAWEMHDFILENRPEYKDAPLQMGRMIKNLREVNHYITPGVFDSAVGKKDSKNKGLEFKDFASLVE